MVDEVDYRKFTFGYLMTFTERAVHGNQDWESVLHYPL